jgi:tetratricopeptide (TPR) repeat protein
MQRALQRQEEGSACVIPILIREVGWTKAPFAHLQALPTDAKPLATWQDEETALADVTAGIRRTIEELPLLAASPPRADLPALWNIPYPRNPFFLGRDDELAQLRSHLQAGKATALSQPQAISGLGGIGKTQLALEYAYRTHQDYQAVLWARAESTEALVSSYVAIASLLRLPEREAKEQELAVQAVKMWLLTHRGWLLILDNADELALLADFLPPALGGHMLLTTRAVATGRLAHRLEIETLLPEQGALFLLRRAGLIAPDAALAQASLQERELALQITQELGGLPLALDQAGAYLEETGMDLASYWHIYQQHRADLLYARGGLVADHPAPVATTWSLSFQKVEEKNPAAAELLRLCACLAPDAIAEEIFVQGASLLGPVLSPVAADAFLLNQAIEALRAYSLVRRDPATRMLSIHRLVQTVLQGALEEVESRSWAERAMLTVNATFPKSEQGTWPQCERLLPHALLAAHSIERYQITSEEAGRLLHETARYLQDRARYQEAESLSQQALRIREQQLGPGHPDVAASLHNLADLYREQGKYAEAEPLSQRALRIFEQKLGPEHSNVAVSLNNLAIISHEQGRYAEAEPLYRRALHIWELQLGPEHLLVADPLTGLAALSFEQGKYEQAEPLYRRALYILERAQGSQHPEAAETMHGFARLREAQGNSEEARDWYARALAVREQALGAHHLKTMETRTRLIALRHAMGQHEEAAQLEAAQSET